MLYALYAISCQKSEIIEEVKIGDTTTKFLIDDNYVDSITFLNQSSNMISVQIYKSSDDLKSTSNNTQIEHRAYSSEEKYIGCGRKYGFDFKKQLDFEKIMIKYAKESGAIDEYEKSGEVLDVYNERLKFVYDSIFNDNVSFKSVNSLFVTLYEYPTWDSGGGRTVLTTVVLPAMYPGWNNRVSSIEFVGLGGGIHIYNRTFLIEKLTTIINWGFTKINLPYGVDDQMSSCWTI